MNNLKLLGLLGFLGLLGIVTENSGFYGFFGFFSFFAISKRPDERITKNAYKAGFNAFVVSLIGLSSLVTAISMKSSIDIIAIILAVFFISTIVTFVASFIFFEKKGDLK